MRMNDHGKLIILLAALVGAFGAMFSHSLDQTAAVAIISAVLGYVTGNGVLAVRNQAPSPAIGNNTGGTVAIVPKDAISVVPVDELPPKAAD